jgi:putative ABC transport system substrate-binding protein
MNRRDLIALVGSITLVPLRAIAQAQAPGLPVIGFINTTSPMRIAALLEKFRHALRNGGFVEGRHVQIEYRWADGKYESLRDLAADLVRRNPVVIVATGGTVVGKAAMAVTSTIPILFIAGFDPVQEGLVASIRNPGGNATGVAVYTAELVPKRLEMLHQLVPGQLSMLVNPGAVSTPVEIRQAQAAAQNFGFDLLVLEAQTDREIESAFAQAARGGAAGVIVSADSFFTGQHAQIVALAARHKLPACYPWKLYVDAGGLLSYGPELQWAFELLGAYAAQILKGATPDKLPVQLPTRFNTTINLKTARALQLTIPPLLVADDIVD